MSLLDFLLRNHREVLELVLEHLLLVSVATGIAIAIGVPLGILLTRKPSLSKPVLGFANIMQTVPSLALFGFLIAMFALPMGLRSAEAGNKTHEDLMMGPYSMVAIAVMAFSFFVAIFYSLSALHNERRDRSILFWKSLPVSDATTVLSKALVPIVILPLVALAVIFGAQAAMFAISTAVVLMNGIDPAVLTDEYPVQSPLSM